MPRLRVVVVQIRTQKADHQENLTRIGGVLRQIAEWEDHPDLLVFPECITSGYFVEGGVREVAVTGESLFRQVEELHRQSGLGPLQVVLGFYERYQNRLFNSGLVATLGGPEPGIDHIHRKIFLPTYGVFDEERFVDGGTAIDVFRGPWGTGAVLICEDLWHSLVSTIAALRGATVLVVPSASPGRGPASVSRGDGPALPESSDRWVRLARSVAEEHGVFVVLAQAVGFEGGKGFPGGSFVMSPSGEVRAMAPVFEEAVLSVELDLDEITRVRSESPLLSDLELKYPHLIASLNRSSAPVGFDRGDSSPAEIEPVEALDLPIVGPGEAGSDPLAIDPELLRKWLVDFIDAEVVRRRSYRRALVGLSGGVDSSLTAYLAADALGAENVTGVRMPYRTSSPESSEHAELVARELGIELRTVDITKAVDGYFDALGEEGTPLRRGNVMARTRMITLFDLSAGLEALPLGTGNKTERLLGYFTWHADDSPPINPLGDLFKSQVWELARHMGVPAEIVDKPATADLVQGQTDESDLGVGYRDADYILHWLLKGLRTEEIEQMGCDAEHIRIVERRLKSTHWKRRPPTVAMVSQTAIGEFYLRPVDY